MNDWDGKERRQGMFDKDFYDKMMEIHSNMKYMTTWAKDHDDRDDLRFDATNKKVDWVTKLAYMGIGALGIMQILIQFVKQ